METFPALLAICAVNSPHNGQWRRALKLSLIRAWINGWVNDGEAGDMRRHRAHYDVIVMYFLISCAKMNQSMIESINEWSSFTSLTLTNICYYAHKIFVCDENYPYPSLNLSCNL